MNNLKPKVDDLDLAKLKTVPVDLKKLCDVVNNEVVINRKFNTLNKDKSKKFEKENSWFNYFNLHNSIQYR